MTDEMQTLALSFAGGGTGLALARGVEYAIRRVADAYRDRAKRRDETEAAKAKSAGDIAETESAVEYIAAETMRDLVASVNRAIATSEAREAKCQVDLAQERRDRIAALAEAESRCKDAIAEVRREMRGNVRDEVRRTLSPHGGIKAGD